MFLDCGSSSQLHMVSTTYHVSLRDSHIKVKIRYLILNGLCVYLAGTRIVYVHG